MKRSENSLNIQYLSVSAFTEQGLERDLIETLLSNYSIYARPVQDPSQSIQVSIGVAMKQIIDLVSPGPHEHMCRDMIKCDNKKMIIKLNDCRCNLIHRWHKDDWNFSQI